MKISKTTATALWVIVVVVLFGLLKFGIYKVDMYYSNLAPKQFEDDSAYGIMKFRDTVEPILWIIYSIIVILIVRRIIKLWPQRKAELKSE